MMGTPNFVALPAYDDRIKKVVKMWCTNSCVRSFILGSKKMAKVEKT